MEWFLVNIRFKFDDGHIIKIKGWYQGKDYIDAVELARLDRQWDLRPYMREGEFIHPEKVVEATFTVKQYNVVMRFKERMDGIGQKLHPNAEFPHIPSVGEADVAELHAAVAHPWERHGDYDG